MRCTLLFVVLSLTCCVDNTIGDDNLDIAGLLKIGIRFVLLNLKRSKSVTLTDSTTIVLPDDIKNISIGSLKLDNAYAYGFENLDIQSLSASNLDAPDESTKTNLCLDLVIDHLGLSSLYDADIGILNEIPIYGNGEFNVAASKINLDLCLNLITENNVSVLYVEDLSLKLKLHDSPSLITGFWKNEEVSNLLTLIINVLEQLIFMFISYEDECFSCVASEVVQYVINSIIPSDKEDFNLDCDCLKAVFNGKYDIESKLEKMVTSYVQGAKYSFTDREIEDLKGLLEELLGYVMQALRDKGFNL